MTRRGKSVLLGACCIALSFFSWAGLLVRAEDGRVTTVLQSANCSVATAPPSPYSSASSSSTAHSSSSAWAGYSGGLPNYPTVTSTTHGSSVATQAPTSELGDRP